MIKNLTERDVKVLRLRLEGVTQKEVGREIGIVSEHVSSIESRALAKAASAAIRDGALTTEEFRAVDFRTHELKKNSQFMAWLEAQLREYE
jgi:transcriptional regulator